MDFDSQSGSTSLSSLANVEIPEKIESRDKTLAVLEASHEETWNEIEGVQEEKEKKLKVVSQSESENQNQDELNVKSLIDQLPPEMLMEILKHLNVKSLTVSRLVSRKWNSVAREIIQSRDDVETVFCCTTAGDGKVKIERKTGGATLGNFIKCFEDTKESPLYTRFVFCCMEPCAFDYADWIKLLSSFGKSIKSLKLNSITFNVYNPDAKLMKLTEKLKNLLVNQLPNLHVFGLKLDYWPTINPVHPPLSQSQLFPTTASSSNEEKTFQLANLKTLYLDEYSFSNFPVIVTDLLRAAVNLEKIEPFGNYGAYTKIKTFQLLHSLGKLGCVQTAQIWHPDDFMPKIQGQSSAPLAFKLKRLDMYVSPSNHNETFFSVASVFISNLFESSKDTLTELKMNPIGFLPHLQLPKFSKLSKLTIRNGQKIKVIPAGINHMEIFPLLQNLESAMPLTVFFPDDETQNENLCFPKLKTLKIKDAGMTKEGISQISQVFPNLKEFKLCSGSKDVPIKNFPEVGEAIWTHLTKLESLELKIDLRSPANAFPAVDSTFTGFSGEDCSRLDDLIEDEQAVENQESQMKSESKNQLDAERINPSILDLKDLRKLQVHCLKVDYGWNIPEFMSISQKCAFKLMENLAYEIKELQ